MNTAFWYASRATGIVALLLLTAVLVLGILVNRQGRLPGLPRFAVTDLHRNLSLLSVAFIAVHVLTAVLDTYVHIPLASAVIPFASGYERLWLALGAVSLDIMLAMIVTSLLRGRLNRVLWRAVHLLAYASWPVAFAHSIGSSKDLQQGWMLVAGHRLRDDRLGGGNLAAGARRPAGAQGRAGRRGLRPAHRLGGQAGSPDGGAMTTAVNRIGTRRGSPAGCRAAPPAAGRAGGPARPPGPVRPDAVPRAAPALLIADIEASGLTGRGGAAFPVHRKLAAVARAGPRQGRKVVVANGAESEPASRKDEMLLRLAPNLVLDGLQLAAEAVGATEAHLYLHHAPGPQILRALAERASRGLDWLGVTITQAPPRFLAGQEAAVVNRLGGGPALPTFQPPRVSERGLGGAPTLVQNAETLAHLALIARYGPRWFRAVGTATSPAPCSPRSTAPTPGPTSSRRRSARRCAPCSATATAGAPGAQAWLVGGYHGTWLPLPDAAGITLDNASLRRFGAAAGAGVLAALPSDRCGLTEAARVTGYLAAESAGQCGPCLNGLPRIAAALAELAGPGHRRQTRADLERWSGLVKGRGACNHPDGTVRFVRSALTVFEPEIRRHARGQCSATDRRPFLPLPDGLPTREEDWI